MKKKLNVNSHGFVLAETIIVAVAVSAIFALVFKHFYPLIGLYTVRETYDDVDSKYGTYWFKRMIQSPDFNASRVADMEAAINSNKYYHFSCDQIDNVVKQQMCYQMLISLEVNCDDSSTDDYIETCADSVARNNPRIYITKYSLVDFKSKFEDGTYPIAPHYFSSGFVDYITYLPNYNKVVSLNRADYRIIIEYYRHRFDNEPYAASGRDFIIPDTENDFYSFGTIEVKK